VRPESSAAVTAIAKIMAAVVRWDADKFPQQLDGRVALDALREAMNELEHASARMRNESRKIRDKYLLEKKS
jgi:hypothetical protein